MPRRSSGRPVTGLRRTSMPSWMDVLYGVLCGSAQLDVDGDVSELGAGTVVIVEKGRSRVLSPGSDGVRYLTVHVRRHGLQIGSLQEPTAPRR